MASLADHYMYYHIKGHGHGSQMIDVSLVHVNQEVGSGTLLKADYWYSYCRPCRIIRN